MAAAASPPTLTEGELTLRAWREADLEAAGALADDELLRWSDVPAAPGERRYDEALVSFVVELDGVDGPVGLVQLRPTGPGVGVVSWATYKPYRQQRIATRAVRMLAAYAFTELGLDRLHAEVDRDNVASSRVAVRAGFRREGVMRGATARDGERRDLIVYGLRRDDPRPDTLLGWTSLMDSVLPKKRVIAHVVVRDTAGRVLLCTTGFKRDLELPGGVVEPNEDPTAAARREIREELGVDLPVGAVIAIDWLPPWQGWGDAIEILYDGGVHEAALIDRLVPDGREILEARWYAADELDGKVSALNARRLPRVLAEPDRIHQLRAGEAEI